METLFRFNIVRDAHRAPDEADPIDLSANTPFQQAAAAIPLGPSRLDQLRAHAKNFIASPKFVTTVTANRDLERLGQVSAAVDQLIQKGQITRNDVGSVLTGILGADISAFVLAPALLTAIENVADSMLAVKLSRADHNRPLPRLAAVLRGFDLICRFVNDPAFPANAAQLAAALRRTFRLPRAILASKASPPAAPAPSTGPHERLKDLVEIHDRFTAAIGELRGTRPGGYAVVSQVPIPGVLPPEKFRPIKLFEAEQSARLTALKGMVSDPGMTGTRRATAAEVTGAAVVALAPVSGVTPYLQAGHLIAEKPDVSAGAGARMALIGRPDFKPVMPGLLGLRLSTASQRALSPKTKQALADLGLDPAQPLPRTVQQLTAERRRVYEQALSVIHPINQKCFRRMGALGAAMAPSKLLELLPSVATDPTGVPTTHADIRPSGIMDLLLVKQQLKGYETAEVSDIANMLKGESTERIRRTRLETESIITTESERTVATEQQLESTDRFEMRLESERALQQETAAKGSCQVKGKYGPSVEFMASGEASWQQKTQQSERAATETARAVTQKAAEKVADRALRRETLRVNRQVEDTNRHTFDNTAGSGHVLGIYQWVTKVYEAQVFKYGPRTFYDFMIPQPGAFLREAFTSRRASAIELEKPCAFEITPDQINEDNYQIYVTLYGATDVNPPPEPFVTESYDFNAAGLNRSTTNSTRIKIPDGYHAIHATVGALVTIWDGDWAVAVVVGQQPNCFRGDCDWVWATDLNEETGSIPFGLLTFKVADVAIAAEVYCEATTRALDLWRAETHAKLINAYCARLSEYEAKLAEMEAQAPSAVVMGPEAQNRAIMVDELKRACISVLTEQHFDQFDAIRSGADKLPEIDFEESRLEGSYVRFFEHAFEWENLSWVSYPYFWGPKSAWREKAAIEDDDDPEFGAFLRAGYARVQIPIRPGFEGALDHFRLFGEPWLGGPLPSISDDLYLPIAEELAEGLGRPAEEVPMGASWEVRVPTTLVKLREDNQLPSWEKQPDGSWRER